MIRNPRFSLCAAALTVALCGNAAAQENAGSGGVADWVHGDWKLVIGATGMVAPDFYGAKDLMFAVSPIISLGKAGPEARFTSRNDNISILLFDNGAVRAGLNGKILFPRDAGDSAALKGLDPLRWGGEIGGFAEFYPTDWLRLRGEVRQGVRTHHGVVAELRADAFQDVTPAIRISGGPRMRSASADFFDAYFGVNSSESTASGLSVYDPGSGLGSVGVGGAIDWRTTEQFTTSLFGEYERLVGPAADSSVVEERGSVNQFTFGVSAAYRFDFTL